jgi:L-lactate dehydrogenase complex protein LldG
MPGMKPTDLADVDYGILRAAFGVAETGSVCLTEAELGVNHAGLPAAAPDRVA